MGTCAHTSAGLWRSRLSHGPEPWEEARVHLSPTSLLRPWKGRSPASTIITRAALPRYVVCAWIVLHRIIQTTRDNSRKLTLACYLPRSMQTLTSGQVSACYSCPLSVTQLLAGLPKYSSCNTEESDVPEQELLWHLSAAALGTGQGRHLPHRTQELLLKCFLPIDARE